MTVEQRIERVPIGHLERHWTREIGV